MDSDKPASEPKSGPILKGSPLYQLLQLVAKGVVEKLRREQYPEEYPEEEEKDE